MKNNLTGRWRTGAAAASTESPNYRALRTNEAAAPEVQRLSAPVKLVYSCAGDKEYYHTAAHLPENCDRVAMSQESALHRGLKPCRKCSRE